MTADDFLVHTEFWRGHVDSHLAGRILGRQHQYGRVSSGTHPERAKNIERCPPFG
jgi:hypothetical protein